MPTATAAPLPVEQPGDHGVPARAVRRIPGYHQRFYEAAKLTSKTLKGDRLASVYFMEAMSTSDFPYLFGDILQRSLVDQFAEVPTDTTRIAMDQACRDFRPVQLNSIDGVNAPLEKVGERGPYPEATPVEGQDTIAVENRGRIIDLSWQMLVNDDLGAFRRLPRLLAQAARNTESKIMTELYVDSNGPHASLFNAGNRNQIITANGSATNNPPLSIAGLEQAFKVLANQRDVAGNPILITSVYLVVPQTLEVTANNILNALQLEVREAGGTANQTVIASNWMRNRLTLIIDPWIPMVATTANASTSWFMFADPNRSRAALAFAKLVGHEEPAIWVKTPNAISIGGGAVGWEQGDFEYGTIRYRIRYPLGSARIINTQGYKAAVASNGTGS